MGKLILYGLIIAALWASAIGFLSYQAITHLHEMGNGIGSFAKDVSDAYNGKK